ncbi:protein SMAX1-LIKE 3-like isoform X2 [Diospyros lotus]|uniref:protein SMAX1-LIKE 3-like isoform X2 n=1 Tax=Diospyros lotus TaxID=55363 RepID=UPI00224F4A61|nr:protein SMAX1-LIKE 3-like isoform X2 [Diospyros lotus]
MRTAAYTAHQTLATEAAAVVRQAISLAKRRGHAQVTPLHVAAAMLASSTGLLRAACFQSHSHPLQLKALELCFNVALNRLPTGPTLGHPSLSNALVAAVKRAQAHQRRSSSTENQQQPILALKIELEQLLISILDDPSVSRVMREAGFPSLQVKTNVEQAVAMEISSQNKKTNVEEAVSLEDNTKFLSLSSPNDQVHNNNVTSVIDLLMSKERRSIVLLGENLALAEGVFRGVMEKFDTGNVPADLKNVQFISLPLFTSKNLPMGEAEEKLGKLRGLAKSCLGRGVVWYLGDLEWVSEFWSNNGGKNRNYFCPVELMIVELGKLVCGVGESKKLWLMGVSTLQAYMKCKSGQPSLETLWQLHPLTVPVGSLGLSLNLESDLQGQPRNESRWLQIKTGVEGNESRSIAGNSFHNELTAISTSSSLPSWLQQYREENRRKTVSDQEFNRIRDPCKKWNSICSSGHKQPHPLDKAFEFSSLSPPSSNSISSLDGQSPNLQQTLLNWPVIFEAKPTPPKEYHLLVPGSGYHEDFGSNLRGYNPGRVELKPDLLSNPNSSPNSASSSEAEETKVECLDRFKDFDSENFTVLCNELKKRVPWRKDIIPDIASTILQRRSGTTKRRSKLDQEEEEEEEEKEREETWLVFLGVDFEGKEKIAKELADLIFGCHGSFATIGLSSFSSTSRADSREEFSSKRARDESGSSYIDRFAEAVQENPHRVFFLEDIEQADYCSQKGIKRAIESGRIAFPGGGTVPLKDAIVIFCCDSFSSMSRAPSPSIKHRSKEKEKEEEDDDPEGRTLDLNVATEDDGGDEHYSIGNIGILDSADRQIIFKLQVL